MKYKKIELCLILMLGYSITILQAQEAIPASGGNASGIGGSVSYSVGQLVYSIHTGTNGSVSEGVQQPYEISVVSGLEELTINLNAIIYPNPTNDFLQLIVEGKELKELSYQLYDMKGKLLESKNLTRNETSIDMNNLVPSTYFLKVIEGNKEVKTFKITKN